MSNNWDNLAEEAVEALLNGPGYYLAESVFTADEVAAANRIINAHSDVAQAATHFHGEHADKIHLQRRVWNLLNKGKVFVDMVQHPLVMKVFGKILGRQFILGSFAANRLLPGAPGQEPHIDYPYWDLHDPDEFPAGINAGFHMNCQSLISLHEFTAENGATAVVPGSQTRGLYPSKETFDDEHIQLTCPPGSLLLFVGMIWHCSMPNNSSGERTSVLGQYLPKFVKPMEALDRSVDAAVRDAATPELHQLLGLDLRYPELLEDSEAGNAEGRKA
ncbi:MAG: phytanoyl-CoA dioxygenase family protein [Alphaproteobacteria bacterium]|nr:phytanoyl-CoA dioxygenase family protein [Alphaproteobacteria bacterium]MBL6672047.1 phytanoyl-CoA dioxygenase family protein [Alphaproteobacteria bacterium]